MVRAIVILLAVLLAFYAAYCAQMWSVQRRMMFPGARMSIVATQQGWPARARSVEPAAAVRGIWVPAQNVPATTLVYFHGNAEFAFQSVAAITRLAGPDRNVLLVEYPGYAGAPGAASMASIGTTSQVAYDWLVQQAEVDPRRIVAIGRSVGSGPASELSRHRPLAALVLVSGFTAVSDMARDLHVPGFLIRDPFDNRAAIGTFGGPVLVLHGRRDDVIPYAQGVALAQASPRAAFVALGCAHNDCALDGADIRAAVDGFLSAHRL